MRQKRRYSQQQMVESERAPYPQVRYLQHETSPIRWSLVLALMVLGVLLIGGVVLGMLSLVDMIQGHPGVSWSHFTAWFDSVKGWLLAGVVVVVVIKVALPVLEIRAHTAVDRAEAAMKRAEAKKIREETRHLREIRYHNEEHMPDGYIALPNGLGNYGQVIPNGQITPYLLPGNAPAGNTGINPKHLMDFMQRQNVVEADYYEEEQKALPAPADLHIPTFRESLDAEMIGPGQAEILICHELVRDEETGALTGEMIPYHGRHEDNSTNFLGGSSKSGKTTYMTHVAGQGALMNALYYCIDPHLVHPEKSVAKKLEALAHAFILPPAKTDAEIRILLDHAKAEALARVDEKETRYTGRPIVFIVDEALAVLGRAQRTSDKEIIALYRDLAFFMRDLGTQYNKFGMNGIFASQYITKDAFKLPGGNIDFRDGCQNQTLLRLPPNQAQAMRLIDKADLPGIRKLAPGHGYMGFASGDIIRMASGNVTREDIEYVAGLAAPSPDRRKQYSVPTVPAMEDLPMRPRSSGHLPHDFQPTDHQDAEEQTEANGEAPGSDGSQNERISDLSTIKTLREIGKQLKSGKSKAEVVKSFGLPYGRATQEIGAVVDMVAEQIEAEKAEGE